ncbi:MAG: 50S ribosomal protein L35 [Candidatus Brocadiales bacterium]
MPKQKTHKGLAKRVKITASGKIKHRRSFTSHLMSTKNGKRGRQLRRKNVIEGAQAAKIRQMLGQ